MGTQDAQSSSHLSLTIREVHLDREKSKPRGVGLSPGMDCGTVVRGLTEEICQPNSHDS